MTFISAKVDFCSKELFYNEFIRRHFISDILQIPLENISSVRILNPLLRKRFLKQKQGIVDILVELNDSTKIHIEIQIRTSLHWHKRQIFYLAKEYTSDLLTGEDYSQLKRCVSISILDFNLTDRPEYHSVYLLRDEKGNVFTNLLEVHTLELRKNLTGNNRMDDWIRLFNAESEEDLDMIRTSNPGILEAIRELKQINLSRALRELHEARLKEKRDQKAFRDYDIAEALADGTERTNHLIRLLIQNSRSDEIERAVTDRQYQQQLFEEFHL